MPGVLERVDDSGDQRHLWPDRDQVDRTLPRRGDDRRDVLGADIRQALGVGGDPGVAGGAEQLGGAGRARKRPHHRVLATAASDDQNLQAAPTELRLQRAGQLVGRHRGQRLAGHRPARAELDRDLGHRLLVGCLDDRDEVVLAERCVLRRTLAPICSTSLFTSATRPGLFLRVRTPSAVKLVSIT